MSLSEFELTRREARRRARPQPLPCPSFRQHAGAGRSAPTDAEASALLDSIAENLLRLSPEERDLARHRYRRARRAALAARATARPPASSARGDASKRTSRAPKRSTTSRLSFPVRTSVEVVRSAYRTALEGFALPYGDVAVGGWRNTPYVVIQNVGAYLDTPQLPRHRPSDRNRGRRRGLSQPASRSIPTQLDGELERMRRRARKGLVPPDFLIDKALDQLDDRARRTRAKAAASSNRSSAGPRRRTSPATGTPAPARSSQQQVAPALERQIAELQAERAVGNRRSPACGRGRTATNITAGRSRPRRPPT